MGDSINQRRRKLLQYTSLGIFGATLIPGFLLAQEDHRPLRPRRPSAGFHPDVELELTARPEAVPLLPGQATRCWKYHGRVLKGHEDMTGAIPDSYLGPVFRLQKGQKVRIFFNNELPASCVTHWHGLHVPAEQDGHPMYAVNSGQTLVYEFEILNRAGTYWFHPHTHDVTARQVYAGLAGLFIVSDEEEQALDLPRGEFDVPLVLQDRRFDDENQLSYVHHRMETMMGFLGDHIMVNGRPDFVLPVANRSYRLRLLNGSNSRIYKLAWEDGAPVTVIGSDGGLLEKPETRPYVMLAPGERLELFMDFSGRRVGSELTLHSLPFSGATIHGGMGGGMGRHGGMGRGMGRMGGMMGMGSALPLGSRYPVLKVKVTREAESSSPLPSQLSAIKRFRVDEAANPRNPLPIALAMHPMSATLNGRSYDMDDVMEIEKVPVDSLQLIQIYHHHTGMGRHEGMGMSMAHPIHLHGHPFQVVSRSVHGGHQEDYDTVKDGYVDSGWKDTVLVMPGESVRILKPFNDFKGRFMYHCHNLEHEDMGMMRDFVVI